MWRVSLLCQDCGGHRSTRRFVFSCKEEKLPFLEESESGCPQRGAEALLRVPVFAAQEQGKCVLLTLVAKEA